MCSKNLATFGDRWTNKRSWLKIRVSLNATLYMCTHFMTNKKQYIILYTYYTHILTLYIVYMCCVGCVHIVFLVGKQILLIHYTLFSARAHETQIKVYTDILINQNYNKSTSVFFYGEINQENPP